MFIFSLILDINNESLQSSYPSFSDKQLSILLFLISKASNISEDIVVSLMLIKLFLMGKYL
jgi:hypothetical protein